MEEQLYQFKLDETYPLPMVDIDETGKIARDLLWGFQKRTDSKNKGARIVAKHVRKKKTIKKT